MMERVLHFTADDNNKVWTLAVMLCLQSPEQQVIFTRQPVSGSGSHPELETDVISVVVVVVRVFIINHTNPPLVMMMKDEHFGRQWLASVFH